jgi:hypothetical protein
MEGWRKADEVLVDGLKARRQKVNQDPSHCLEYAQSLSHVVIEVSTKSSLPELPPVTPFNLKFFSQYNLLAPKSLGQQSQNCGLLVPSLVVLLLSVSKGTA